MRFVEICLLLFISSQEFDVSMASASRFSALNKKINFLKRTVERDIEYLNFEVLDLRTEIDFLKTQNMVFENATAGDEMTKAVGEVGESYKYIFSAFVLEIWAGLFVEQVPTPSMAFCAC